MNTKSSSQTKDLTATLMEANVNQMKTSQTFSNFNLQQQSTWRPQVSLLRAQSFTSLKRQISAKTQMEVLHLAGALMEHFLEGSAPLRLWYINSEEKLCMYYSYHLG